MAIVSTLLSLGTAAYQIISGVQAQKRAKKAMNELDEVDFDKSIAETMGPAIEQEMRAIEQIKQQQATASEALQGAGSANLIGGLSNIQQSAFGAINQQYDAIRKQEFDYDRLRLQDEQFGKTGRANQVESQAAGLAAEFTAGGQNIASGIQGAGTAVAGYEASKLEKERYAEEKNFSIDEVTKFILQKQAEGVDPAEIQNLVKQTFYTDA